MNKYKVLDQQIFNLNDFSIKTIELNKRYQIMKWRNEQIYHLRQEKKINKKEQDNYFETVIKSLFDKEKPDQLLFSFYYKEEFIGYGGLVHINWKSFNAEVSFLMNTVLEEKYFKKNWNVFLKLIEKVAFLKLHLKKIYIYAYDLRPKLFEILIYNNYKKEADLKYHYFLNGKFYDTKIYSKLK